LLLGDDNQLHGAKKNIIHFYIKKSSHKGS
jgi:hypothetical protein